MKTSLGFLLLLLWWVPIVLGQQSGSQTGVLTVDKWSGVPPHVVDLRDVYREPVFYTPPNSGVTNATSYRSFQHLDVVRMRGYLTPQVSGTYHFWITALNTAELWLSPSSSKAQKKLIASIERDDHSSRVDIQRDAPNLWDRFASQMSVGIELQAGQTYFLEAIHRNNDSGQKQHLGIAWAPPGQPRESLPFSLLQSYDAATDPLDTDDDYLPDSFENSYPGLSITDNGLIDQERQGERGDYDFDGLTNRDEFLLGTNPVSTDSDGDGISDLAEVRQHGTNPLVANVPSQTLLSEVDLSSFIAAQSGDWHVTSHGLLSSSFRGRLTYQLDVPGPAPARHYLVNLRAALLGEAEADSRIVIRATLNGSPLGNEEVRFSHNQDSLWQWITPQLSPGTHTLSLFVDNILGRRSLVVKSLQLARPTGPDLNGDGEPDWVVNTLARDNTFDADLFSRASPAFLEGKSRTRPVVSVPGGGPLILSQATTANTWFTNVPLSSTGSTTVTSTFEGSFSETKAIAWTATNLLAEETLLARPGDSFKFQVQPFSGATGQSTTIGVRTNLARQGTASQSTTAFNGVASRAIDGNTDGVYGRGSVTHTQDQASGWWQVDLGATYPLDTVVLFNRTDPPWGQRLSNYQIQVRNASGSIVASRNFHTHGTFSSATETWTLPSNVSGRTVRIQRLGPDPLFGQNYLSFAEVQVFGKVQSAQPDTSFVTHQFVDPGRYFITGSHANGQTGTTIVEVKKANFQSNGARHLLAVESATSYRGVDFFKQNVDSDLFFDGGDVLTVLNEPDISSNKFKIRVLAKSFGPTNLAARLFEGGPIVNTYPINMIRVADTSQTEFFEAYVNYDERDYVDVNVSLLIDGLPPTGFLRLRFIAGGAELEQGASDVFYSATDLADGFIRVPLRNEIGTQVGRTVLFCYEFEVFTGPDPQRDFVGKR